MSLKSRTALLCAFALSALALVPAGASAFGPNLSFSSYGEAAGQLSGPGDAAVAPDGSVYVSDFSNRRINVFAPDGSFQFAFGRKVAADGSEADICTATSGCQVGDGTGVAGAVGGAEGLDIAGGRVYVANLGYNRVDVFNLAGQFLFAFGHGVNAVPQAADKDICTAVTGCQTGAEDSVAGALSQPQGLGIGPDGNVYVADRLNNRIDVFSPQGLFLSAFGAAVGVDGGSVCSFATGCKAGGAGTGVAGEIGKPFDVKVSADGLVFISDRGNKRIDVFTTAGAFQRAFAKGVNAADGSDVCTVLCRAGDAGVGAGAVTPTALEVDAAGNVYVADATNNRLSQFTSAGQFQQAFGAGVVDGAAAFQVCTAASGCQAGLLKATVAGAVSGAFGIALDCKRGIYASEHFASFARLERFADPNPVVCPPVSEPPPGTGKPSNKFSFGRLLLNRRKGTATLLVRVPGPGSVAVAGKGIRPLRRAAKRAGTVKLAVSLTGKTKRGLLRTGKARVRAKVTFRPTGGDAAVKARALVLRKQLR